MPIGYIRIQVMDDTCCRPLSNATIRIYKLSNKILLYEHFLTCDEDGKSLYVEIQYDDILPYETCHIEVKCESYQILEIRDIQVFENEKMELEVYLKRSKIRNDKKQIQIPKHQLNNEIKMENPFLLPVKRYDCIAIPNLINVYTRKEKHKNIEVNYIQYIKAIAVLEIYPTWSKDAILAYIYCLLSITLNDIYKGKYRKKGYDFDVISRVQNIEYMKHCRIHNRVTKNIDKIFNEYIKKEDGYDNIIVPVNELNDKAETSSTLQILKSYIGNAIRIVTSNDIIGIKETYSGRILKKGDKGIDVLCMQRKLNIIFDHHLKWQMKEDSIFGDKMESSVGFFQYLYSLDIDCKIGKATWYKILFIYEKANKKELDKDMERDVYGKENIQNIQHRLNRISSILPNLPILIEDGIYGNYTKETIRNFCLFINIPFHESLNDTIIDKITNMESKLNSNEKEIEGFPKLKDILSIGSNGEDVLFIQQKFNFISQYYSNISQVKEDGIYSKDFKKSVLSIQKMLGIEMNGIIDNKCWYLINVIYAQLKS